MLAIFLQFSSNPGFSLFPLMPMMHSARRVLQAQRNQQSNRDRKQMEKEFAHTMNARFRRMNFQHRCNLRGFLLLA